MEVQKTIRDIGSRNLGSVGANRGLVIIDLDKIAVIGV